MSKTPFSKAHYVTREKHDASEGYVAGVDIAGPGSDETVVCVRQGNAVIEMTAINESDPRGQIVKALNPYHSRNNPRQLTTFVDEVGIGYHCLTHLKDLGFRVLGINVGKSAADSKRFVNLRAELLWGLRERFQAGEIDIPPDEALISQLASLRFSYTSRGLLEIESKIKAARRGVPSPDRADALMLAFADSPAVRKLPGRRRPGIIG